MTTDDMLDDLHSRFHALLDGFVNINHEQKSSLKKAEAEIVRLREGLRDLRHGIFKDSDAVNELIDSLLKIEETTDF